MTDPDFSPSAFLLDLDGVLVHSQEAHLAAYDRAFRGHGLSFGSEMQEMVERGMSREEILIHAQVPDETLSSISRAKEDAFLDLVRNGSLAPAKGVEAFLRTVKLAGLPSAIVSNSALAEDCIAALGLGWAFDTVVDGTCNAPPKPSAEPWLLAATHLGVSPTSCIAIEDSSTGAEGARAAGMFVVGLGAGLAEHQVNALFPDMAAIPIRRWLDGPLPRNQGPEPLP